MPKLSNPSRINHFKAKEILLYIFSFFILCGFSDCSFSASNAIYELDSCSDPQSWKSTLTDENTSVIRSDNKNTTGPAFYGCTKLVHYHIKTKINEEKKEWGEYELYIGLKKQGGTCQLVVSTPWVGPPSSDEQERLKHWEHMNQSILKQITGSNLHSASLNVIHTKEDYTKWCEEI